VRIVEAKVGIIGGPLRRSVGNAHRRWTERKSVLIVLRDEEGRIGLGEAAPLPGYSPDTLEECHAALSRVVAESNGAFASYVSGLTLLRETPAAEFALESLIVDLLGQKTGVPYGDIHPTARTHLARCGLIDGEPTEWDASWEALHERAIRVFKIKIGRSGLSSEELYGLRALRRVHGEDWSLRIDVNGGWSPAEAAARLGSFTPLGIEFVEQPTQPGSLEYVGELPVPWAADESLRNPKELARLKKTPCAAFVLKPSILGGFRRCIEPCGRAERPRMPAVVSHLFEGPVAMAANCAIALGLPDPVLAAGLDTHDALSAWPEMPIPQLQTPGVITPATEPGLGFTREQREEIASWIS
jgi:o-succinylbenzoate synthase